MSYYPLYTPRRALQPLGGYGREPGAYYSTTRTIVDKTFQTPPHPTATSRMMKDSQREYDLWHLPAPEPGSTPPGWAEWETNSNWPFPANYPKPPTRKPTPKPAPPVPEKKPIPQDELELNVNWPLPPPASRKRRASQSAVDAPAAIRQPTQRVEQKTDNRPKPVSSPKKTAKPVIPLPISKQPSQPASASPFLARDSSSLIRFDLRLPYTCTRKLVCGAHWTHLNHDDLRQPACQPPRARMRIYTQACPDWVVEARARSRTFVTVEDVLSAMHSTFNVAVDNERWARDSLDPDFAERVLYAFQMRIAKLEDTKMVRFEDARKRGLLRIDYLGSQRCFAGLILAYGGDNSEWFMMEVSPDLPR